MKTWKDLIMMILALLCIVSLTPLFAVPTDGLVAWYPFSGNAQDASGNGHHGVVFGANIVNDRFYNPQQAYNFYAVEQDYIRVPDHPDLRISNALTIAVWAYRTITPGSFEDLVMKGNDSYGFQYNNSSNEVLFHLTSNGWRNLNSNFTPSIQNWFHIAGTYDGEWQRVYVNGVLTNSAYFTGGINVNNEPLDFGYKVAGDNAYYTGIMDDCCVFNRALSAEEIWDLYKIGLDVSTPSKPLNVSIDNDLGNMNITWNPVNNADYYRVYSSNSPDTGFSLDVSGTFGINSWTAAPATERKFYKVKAGTNAPGQSPDMVWVDGGTFNNGISEVTLDGFAISKYEVTQAQYYRITGETFNYIYGGGPHHPVYSVSWLKAIAFCNLLSYTEGLTPCYTLENWGTDPSNWPAGYASDNSYHNLISCDWNANGYRLPTEMEWEFAARGGNQSNGYTYSGSNSVATVAWYYYNSSGVCHQVGTKAANELGLHDMSGNTREWVWDKYGDLPEYPQTNPTGALVSSYRVDRGGSCGNGQNFLTVTNRMYDSPSGGTWDRGFRVCRRVP